MMQDAYYVYWNHFMSNHNVVYLKPILYVNYVSIKKIYNIKKVINSH